MSSFLSGLTGAVTSAVNSARTAVVGPKNNLRRQASANSKAHEAAPTGAQVTMASGATYTKVANGQTGTFGPSTKGGRRVNKNKSKKNRSKKNKSKKNRK